MRKSSSFMGVLAVGALAVGVSVYAAPRADGIARGKSEASRLVTGASQDLQRVVEGGIAGGGSYVGVKNDYLGLDGSAVRLFFEIQLGGWGGVLDTYQISVDQASFCSGSGACLTKPVEACGTNAECVGIFGAGSKCTGGICDFGYQDAANPDFAINGISAVSQINVAFGSTKLPGFTGETDDGRKWYGGDLALDLDGGRGTYTICPLATAATFLVLDTGEIQIGSFNCATVEVPVGKCCVVNDGTCTDDTTKAECDALGGLHFPGSPCSAGCIECVSNADCDDGDACTSESCNTTTGQCVRGLNFDAATECCNGGSAAITLKDDGDDCSDDFCDGTGSCENRPAGSCGTAAHSPTAAGGACDDDNACTFDDVCDGAGGCAGTDANTVPCATDDDCLAATGGALECQDTGFCFCTLSPPLTWRIDGSDAVDPNCFDDGEKISAVAHVGPSLDVITGGEVAFTYDPSCMQFNGVVTVAPFTNTLFYDSSVPGEVFIAVGIDLGGTGVAGGNFDLVEASFTKAGGCAACNLCFTDVNPRHTRLTNSVGQVVTVQPECSKDIRGDGQLTMDTPDGGKFNTECDSPTRDVSWGTPSAADTCDLTEFWCGGLYQNAYTGEVVDASAIGVDPYSGGTFPIGSSVFCCNAGNDCGETLQQCWTVEVNDETSLDVQLQLSPTMAVLPGEGLERCIKFEVFSNCTQAPLVFEENVVFGGLFDLAGKVDTSIKIPSAGQFECITARDQLHTLRSCYTFGAGDCDADGVLHATFKGDPFFGGNWLVGGNLDGYKKQSATASLNAIDITDFGMFVSQFPNDYGTGATPCGTAGPHADINGDGLVDMLDYTFITMNFLLDSKDCCCPGSAAKAPSGRSSISARAEDMGKADLDGNGVVDLNDMSLFLQGYQAPKGSRSRTGLR